MTRYCRTCRSIVRVVRWDRDNPVLSCGHVKHRSVLDDRLSECAIDIRRAAENEAQVTGMSALDIQTLFLKAALAVQSRRFSTEAVTFCPICEQEVSIVETKDGEKICGGNYLNNPGCGCILNKSIEQRLQCG